MSLLSTFGIIVGVCSGISGTVLGIWNRLEQSRESKIKLADRTPYFTAEIDPADPEKEWRRITFAWQSPRGIGAHFDSVEVVRPKGVRLRWTPKKGDAPRVGRKVAVEGVGFLPSDKPSENRPRWHIYCDLVGKETLLLKVRGRERNSVETKWVATGEAKPSARIIPGLVGASAPAKSSGSLPGV